MEIRTAPMKIQLGESEYLLPGFQKIPLSALSPDSVDWIYVRDHLELSPYTGDFLEEFRVLKNGGRIDLLVPDTFRILSARKELPPTEVCKRFYGEKNEIRSTMWLEELSTDLFKAGFSNIGGVVGPLLHICAYKFYVEESQEA